MNIAEGIQDLKLELTKIWTYTRSQVKILRSKSQQFLTTVFELHASLLCICDLDLQPLTWKLRYSEDVSPNWKWNWSVNPSRSSHSLNSFFTSLISGRTIEGKKLAILEKWVPYSQRYLVLGLVGFGRVSSLVVLGLLLRLGLALWLVSGIALNKYRCE